MNRLSHALVLTAGLGTRLDPLTRVRAKPAVPVAGEPLVRRIIRGLVAQSVTELVLNLHHLPATIAAVVGDGRDLGATVRYSWEQPVILGSAGGPALALPLINASPRSSAPCRLASRGRSSAQGAGQGDAGVTAGDPPPRVGFAAWAETGFWGIGF
jgi:hypothetical protein